MAWHTALEIIKEEIAKGRKMLSAEDDTDFFNAVEDIMLDWAEDVEGEHRDENDGDED